MKRFATLCLLTLACISTTATPRLAAQGGRQGAAPKATTTARPPLTLDIYFIDVEGGQATLMVTPAGESLLMDAGYPGDSSLIAPAFGETPSKPGEARDPERIMAAAKAAGISKIDILLMTHSHADHGGGVLEITKLMPVGAIVNHIPPTDDGEKNVAGTHKIYERFIEAGAALKHIEPKPGEKLPLKGIDARFVSANGAVLTKPLAGAGQKNTACTPEGIPAQEKYENPFSNGVKVTYGAFRFLNVGDLSGPNLFALGCPNNLVGQAEVYLVAHHGGNDAADPSLFAALKPVVSIFNNGVRKGAQADALATAKKMGGDVWQLHKTSNANAENTPDERIANLNESTAHWIKLSAKADGSFTVTNARTGTVKSYNKR